MQLPCYSRLVIPYQETIGSYNCGFCIRIRFCVIPYQETIGSYNWRIWLVFDQRGYTNIAK